VEVSLVGGVAQLSWVGASGPGSAVVALPEALDWSAHRGDVDPVLGWYSPRFGERVPSTTLVGAGAWTGQLELTTVVQVADVDVAERSAADALLLASAGERAEGQVAP
jgi:hypothetical protein